MSQEDAFAQYEKGLNELIQRIGASSTHYKDLLVYQMRLVENIHRARVHGDTETRRAERAEIIGYVNQITLHELGITFKELCGPTPRVVRISRTLLARHIFTIIAIIGIIGGGLFFLEPIIQSRLKKPSPTVVIANTTPSTMNQPTILATAESSLPFPTQQQAPTFTPSLPSLEPTKTLAEKEDIAKNALKEAMGWTIVVSNTFDSTSENWPMLPSNDVSANVTPSVNNNRYRLDTELLQGVGGVAWVQQPPTPNASNFYLCVDIIKVQGPTDSEGGIMFRYDNQEQFYLFRINPERRTFTVSIIGTTNSIRLIEERTSNSIHINGVNRLTVIGKGSHFWFFINGEFVEDIENSELSKGRINFAVRLPRADKATYEFDNLEVRTP